MDGAAIKKQREELETYYQGLYKEDSEVIKKEALEYANGDVEKAKDYIAGYMSSIKQPHTRMIRLITMYLMDYVPYYKKHPASKNIVTAIRNIFREKRYPKEVFDPKDPSKRMSDGNSDDSSIKAGGTSET